MGDRSSNPGCVDPSALIRSASKGDESAWRGLLELYGRRVFAMAKSRCRRDDLAEEIAQSVFVTVATTLVQGGYTEQGKFEPWLFRVTMNRVRDEMRRIKRHAAPTDPHALAQSNGAEDEPERPEESDVRALREAMGELSEADRQVVELRHQGGLGFKEIAAILEEPLGTVLARHHRALRKLKERMEQGTAEVGKRVESKGDRR